MKRFFSCSSSQVAVERWNRRDQKLLEAVQRGDVGRVAALASRKSSRPTKLDANGQSPFHLAASKGLTECLTILLANGADINSKNEDGSTALHLATISCQPQCVKVLLQHGANEDAVDAENRSPLHWAASSGCASSVLLLCDHEAFLDVLDNDGRTPLMIASLGGHAAICSQLLQRGARVNVTDKDDKSALILACEKGSAEVAELLLSHGADAGAVDSAGHDALYYGLRTQDKALWKLLQQALSWRRGGKPLLRSPFAVWEASPSDPPVGSPPKSPRGAEPGVEQKEEREDVCSEEWKWKYEEEQKKVSQLEQELVGKAEESKAQAAAYLGLANQIREQVQELGRLLFREPRAPGGPSPGIRPGGDGMEQGCPLDLLAEGIRELKKQQQAVAAAAANPVLAAKKTEDSSPREMCYEAHGRSQPERGPPQGPVSEIPGEATGQQQTTVGGQALGPEHADQPHAGQKERPKAPGAERASTAAMNQLLLQLREELAAVWREKDAALGALSRPVLEGVLGKSRAEATAAAWEKMEARLEQVLLKLDRTQRGLRATPATPAQESREGARKAGSETIPEEDGEKETGAPGTQRESPGAPGRPHPLGGGLAKGMLEKEVSALRLSNSHLLEELGELGRERQRLQGELLSLSQRLQPHPRGAEPGVEQKEEREDVCSEEWKWKYEEEQKKVSQLEQELVGKTEESKAQAAAYLGLANQIREQIKELLKKVEQLSEEVLAVRGENARLASQLRVCLSLGKWGHDLGLTGSLWPQIKELLKKVEQLSEEVLAVRGENARLASQLRDSQKNHEEIISTYRNHLLSAAQGYMEQDVYNILLRILSRQEKRGSAGPEGSGIPLL
ncbi:PREDICTED: ankyrin repeat domain-containing protein 35 [Myotis davidii]|uniref:ankyrin repeat domain-containing protein 35 n=1 Tax=Myotis davidii TaxID=225400 RepID=UPI000767CEA1|nr:PREDICTED: ankyrin repeat domain-containing protein 35 [Myotis davidii]